LIERRDWLILFFAAAGCTRTSRPLEEALPAALNGGWKLAETLPLAVESAPETIRRLGLRRALSASYYGPANLNLRLYEMTTAAAAFELAQKWRPTETTVPFHHHRYFVVVQSPEMEKAAMISFVRLFEKRLKMLE
jgi:hypothetical protein